MKKLTSGVLAGTVAAALAASLAQQPANAAPPQDSPSNADHGRSAEHRPDNRPGPMTERQTKLREAAVQALASGEARAKKQKGGGSVVELTKDTAGDDANTTSSSDDAVELFDNDKQANILSILSEFGGSGPLHNQIPKPDRDVDNSTTWEPDYNVAYYENLFNGDGESMQDFYLKASEGQYEVTNGVEDWVQVPGDAAFYGANPHEDEGGAWDFIEDTGNSWAEQSGMSTAELNNYLKKYDKWDRYDYDGDGDFNEPDGYIDHFQAIHAGEGEEAGASPDAIWSHRWYVNATDFGKTGPTVNGQQVLFGGARIGDSDYYIGDYTVEPENGGLGVFVHEFGHDLGLPDFYDTAGGENGTAFWTIMSSGSWLGHGEEANEGIGTTPGGFGPDEKAFLGWLPYESVNGGESGSFSIAPEAKEGGLADSETKAVRVNLPDKTTTDEYNTPFEGDAEWWSDRGDDLNNTMTREVAAADTVQVTTQAWYDIEENYDYLYAEYSTDNGATWTKIVPDGPEGQEDDNEGVDGSSNGEWTQLSWSYQPDGGAASLFRFRYQTDGGYNLAGAFLDNITITAGDTTFTDGAEDGANGWDIDGWVNSDGTDTNVSEQYYWIENRQYVGYDDTLRTGPYNFSEAYSRPNWVEFFSFQPGMLVWFADKSQPDNNTALHEGYGQALPVDARPEPFTYPDGTMPSNRRQPYDAVFGTEPIESVCLHKEVKKGKGQGFPNGAGNGKGKGGPTVTLEACQDDTAPIATFDDSDVDAYWSADNPWNSTKVAGYGVTATVTGQDGDNLLVEVKNPSPAPESAE